MAALLAAAADRRCADAREAARVAGATRRPAMQPSQTRLAGCAAFVLAVAACAAAEPLTLRLQVETSADWPDPDALRLAAAQAAGVPVPDLAGVAPRRYTLTLACADAAACAQARQRLQASPLFTRVDDDPRQRPPAPPAPATTR